MRTGAGWHPFAQPDREPEAAAARAPGGGGQTAEALIEAVLTRVARNPGDPRVPTPSFQVVQVGRIANTFLIAFKQAGMDSQTLVFAMDVPPAMTAAGVIEALVTENFLEDLRVDGSTGWKERALTRIGELLFIV